jgi:hypothetical protein
LPKSLSLLLLPDSRWLEDTQQCVSARVSTSSSVVRHVGPDAAAVVALHTAAVARYHRNILVLPCIGCTASQRIAHRP